MNARVIKSNKESNKHQESVAKIYSNVNDELGLTKYYARNDDFNHYCSSSLKFGDPYFGIEYVNILHWRIFIK